MCLAPPYRPIPAEHVVPYFGQSPRSFLPLPTIKDAYKRFEILITFRPDAADGEFMCPMCPLCPPSCPLHHFPLLCLHAPLALLYLPFPGGSGEAPVYEMFLLHFGRTLGSPRTCPPPPEGDCPI